MAGYSFTVFDVTYLMTNPELRSEGVKVRRPTKGMINPVCCTSCRLYSHATPPSAPQVTSDDRLAPPPAASSTASSAAAAAVASAAALFVPRPPDSCSSGAANHRFISGQRSSPTAPSPWDPTRPTASTGRPSEPWTRPTVSTPREQKTPFCFFLCSSCSCC